MPIYEYVCKDCGHSFDALQKMIDVPLTDCPECGKPQLKKLLSAPNFRLKGAGWYETDFKQDKRRNLADEAGKKDGAKGDGDGKSDTKSDTKSDGKAATDKKTDAKKAGANGGSSNSASKSD